MEFTKEQLEKAEERLDQARDIYRDIVEQKETDCPFCGFISNVWILQEGTPFKRCPMCGQAGWL